MDKIKQNSEELEKKEKKEKELKKEVFEKALKDLIEKKYDLSNKTVKKLLKLKYDLSNEELKKLVEKSDKIKEKTDLQPEQLEELKKDLDAIKKFKEEFIFNEEENNDNDDISEIFSEDDGKIVKNLFSQKFISQAKSGKIIPGMVVGTTNSGEKIIKLGAGITIGFLKSFYDIYMIISGKGEYKRKI